MLFRSDRLPKFNRIYVSNSSRFARNIMIMGILRDLRKNKVIVYFLDLEVSSESDKDYKYIKSALDSDENESIDKSKKVKFGQKESAYRGIIHSNGKIYGYKYIQNENRLEIIEDEANIIRLIYKKYSEGFGTRKIANYLKENRFFTRNGVEFSISSIKRILVNEKYMGMNNRMKYFTGDLFQKNSYPKVKKEYLLRETEKIPLIVEKELFEQCQMILKTNIHHINQTEQTGFYRGSSLYSGRLICGDCNNKYQHNVKDDKRAKNRNRIPYYNCSLKKKSGKLACSNLNVREEYVNDAVSILAVEYTNHLESSKTMLVDYCNDIRKSIHDRIDKRDDELINAKTIEYNIENNIYSEFLDQYFTKKSFPREYYELKNPIFREKIEILKNELDEISKTNSELRQEIKEIDNIIIEIKNIDTEKIYTVTDMHEEIMSITVNNNTNNLGYLQQSSIPVLLFKLKLNERIKSLASKYTDENNKNRQQFTKFRDNAVIQIYNNGDMSVFFRPVKGKDKVGHIRFKPLKKFRIKYLKKDININQVKI